MKKRHFAIILCEIDGFTLYYKKSLNNYLEGNEEEH
ncbi:hypothetical protein ABIA69_003157 [Lysinibacillus parviboronicapiens]|uniref:Uncharacterized protein n=1 Tax=Lysinibacillus parviboronicapiens TaxID=436516 RepID=A0ABV2PM29_9BACI